MCVRVARLCCPRHTTMGDGQIKRRKLSRTEFACFTFDFTCKGLQQSPKLVICTVQPGTAESAVRPRIKSMNLGSQSALSHKEAAAGRFIPVWKRKIPSRLRAASRERRRRHFIGCFGMRMEDPCSVLKYSFFRADQRFQIAATANSL